MRDEILLSRDYFDKVVDKIVNETLNDKNCSSMVKFAISISMLKVANDMEKSYLGKKRIINMLNTTVIDRDYFNKVRDEIVNEKLETSELPIEITL